MKLTKDDFELLRSNRSAFLVKAYLSYDPTPTVRECAEVTGLAKSYCQRLMRSLGTTEGTSEGTSKATATKAKIPKQGTSEGTAEGTAEGTNIQAKNKPEPTLTAHLRAVFDTYYLELTQQEYYWMPKEMSALKAIGQKLSKGMQDKGISPNDEAICQNFKLLLSIIEDKWILDNLSPSIINSKYNDIRTQYARRATAQPARGARHKGADFDSFYRAIDESMQ